MIKSYTIGKTLLSTIINVGKNEKFFENEDVKDKNELLSFGAGCFIFRKEVL